MVTTRGLGIGILSFASGIALVQLGIFTASFIIAGAFTALACFIVLKRWGKTSFILLSIFACVAVLGTLRMDLVDPVRSNPTDRFLDASVMLTGVIAEDPDQRTDNTQYVLDIERVNDTAIEHARAIVTLARYPLHALGERLTLSGRLKLPKDIVTDPLRPPFPYVRYLAKDGIGYVMSYPEVTRIEATNEHRILAALSSWKRSIVDRVGELYVEPEGGLLSGILLGERHAVDKNLLTQFRVAGLIHVIVVSGYNMTVVAEAVARAFHLLPLSMRSFIGIVFVWIYAGMVGGGAPVIRAAVMSSLALIARMTGRTGDALRLLFIATGAMILWNPRIVEDDPSFHLSFLATLGLIVLSDPIKKRIPSWIKWGMMRELLSTTIAAQISVFPYILSFSGQLSPYALLANVVALPFIPLSMMLGVGVLLTSVLSHTLGVVVATIGSIPLSWVLFVAHEVNALPWSDAVVSAFPLWATGLLYVALGTFLVRRGFFRKHDAVDIAKE